MAKKKNKRKNKNKNVAGAPLENPISTSPPPPIPPEETIIPNIAEVEKEAFDLATAAFEKHRFDIDVAEEMKNEFDNRYGPTWHCIVGRDFAAISTALAAFCCNKILLRGPYKWLFYKS